MTRRDLLLNLLERAGERGCTTAELLQGGVGSRYGARVKELRSQGYEITAERIREGSWRYVLVSGSASTPLAISGQRMPRSAPVGAEPGTRASEPAPVHPLDAFSTDGALLAGADSGTLFDSPPRKKRTTRSAVTNEWLDE